VLARRDNGMRGLNQETSVSGGRFIVEEGFGQDRGSATLIWRRKYVQMTHGSQSRILGAWRENDHV
jgi:hypothetical protein